MLGALPGHGVVGFQVRAVDFENRVVDLIGFTLFVVIFIVLIIEFVVVVGARGFGVIDQWILTTDL